MTEMKLQNRVDPWGNLHVTPERGLWMGNRGILHDDQKQIVSQWQHYHWVTCSLEYKNAQHHELFKKGNYSELFFLDEATAFSAGHRPCAQCRRQRYDDFKAAWVAVNRNHVSCDNPSYKEIDDILQMDRVAARNNSCSSVLGELPGYTLHKSPPAPSSTVRVLTPESFVRMFSQGFAPQVHISAYR